MFSLDEVEHVVLNNPIFEEAVCLASSELYKERQKALTDNYKVHKSLLKYWTRMSTRCTPFGLFAGCTIGQIGDSTNIRICEQRQSLRHSRLDMNYLCSLIQYFESKPEFRCQLKFYPNDSIYIVGNRLRYVEYIYDNQSHRVHRLQEIDIIPNLDILLKNAQSGKNINELVHLCEYYSIAVDDSKCFIEELIDNQILKSEIEANVTGDDTLDSLIKWISDKPSLLTYKEKLLHFQQILMRLDEPLEHEPDIYNKLYSLTDSIGIKYDKKFLIQTDLYRTPVSVSISNHDIAEINRCLDFLVRLNISSKKENKAMSDFIDAFFEKYELRSIPLLKALDSDIGIGYPTRSYTNIDNPLTKGIKVPHRTRNDEGITLSKVESIILKKYLEKIKHDIVVSEIELKDSDFSFSGDASDIIETTSVLCKLFPNGLVQIKSICGYAERLLGRFCCIDDSINKLVKEICDKEQLQNGDDWILAEIVHLPESRIGNISFRPLLRDCELHYLARSGEINEKSFPVSDLMLRFENGHLTIFSNSMGKRILPMLSNAHNYSLHTTPVYRFLCDFQSYKKTSQGLFSIDNLLSLMGYVPRVRYGSCFLAIRSWRVFESDVSNIDSWRVMNNIPQKIVITEGDNSLYVDFSKDEYKRIFLDLLKKKKMLLLEEFIEDSLGTVVTDGKHPYCAEFVIPFYKNSIS